MASTFVNRNRSNLDDFLRDFGIQRSQLKEKLILANFGESLEAFSRETRIQFTGIEFGFSAETADHYVQVYCKASPPRDFAQMPEWRKINKPDGRDFWQFVPAGGRDSKPVEILFEASQNLTLDAIVGACVWTYDGETRQQMTHPFVIEVNNEKWGVTVGHGFYEESSTSELNSVSYCLPDSPTEDCNDCTNDHCKILCFEKTDQDRVIVISGKNDIVTFNPFKSGGNPEDQIYSLPEGKKKWDPMNSLWIDCGVFKIPNDNPKVKVRPLKVSSVLEDPSVLDELAGKNAYAHKVVTSLGAVGTEPLSLWMLYLGIAMAKINERDTILFKKGAITGWTFGKLLGATDIRVQATHIGPAPDQGDCGAIWWIIDVGDFTNSGQLLDTVTAYPLGYHEAHDDQMDVSYFPTYHAALGKLAATEGTKEQFQNYKIFANDSYVWV
ncbi:hypothetical protein TWF694_010022 [Orbilia ellipsospora]|uniref:Uncharacterized protein n=1 Tax=Orbilia ellipsospora TaxID=2528407 RepID=A0AAV9X9V4_9PEZI